MRSPAAGRLYPELQRHSPAGFGDVQMGQRLPAVGLEAAEGVGQVQAESRVEFRSDLPVDVATVLRRQGILTEVAQVAAAGYDVGVVDRLQKHRDARRLVLAVAVHRH